MKAQLIETLHAPPADEVQADSFGNRRDTIIR
jgi:hypothetical protein